MSDGKMPGAMSIVEGLLSLLERSVCRHESTHRGGAWTICDDCNAIWADDRGGFRPYEDPAEVVAALAWLAGEEVGRAPATNEPTAETGAEIGLRREIDALRGRVREVLDEVEVLRGERASWQTTPAEAKALAEIGTILGVKIPNDAPTLVVDELRRQRHDLAQLALANGARPEETAREWVDRLVGELRSAQHQAAGLGSLADHWKAVASEARRLDPERSSIPDADLVDVVCEGLRQCIKLRAEVDATHAVLDKAGIVREPDGDYLDETSDALPQANAPSGGNGDCWAELIDVLDTYGLGSLRDACLERRALGIERYGVPLGRGDGRDDKSGPPR